MVRRAAAALLFVAVLVSLGVVAYGTSFAGPEHVRSISPVEVGAPPGPPELQAQPGPRDPSQPDMGRVWEAAIAQESWPDLTARGRTSGGRIALTFDDGPDRRATPLVLDALREHDLHATFFVVGSQAAENPDLLRRIVEEGHTIGNHTYDHADMSDLSPERMRGELRSTQEAVDDALGYHYPMMLMRPPYGNPYFEGSDALPAFRRVVRGQGMFPVTWTADPRDYLLGGRPESVVRAVARADEAGRKGERDEVLLLHDNHMQTAQALPGIIDYYEGTGRGFAGVGELLADKYLDP